MRKNLVYKIQICNFAPENESLCEDWILKIEELI